jgi:hypothetical protein
VDLLLGFIGVGLHLLGFFYVIDVGCLGCFVFVVVCWLFDFGMFWLRCLLVFVVLLVLLLVLVMLLYCGGVDDLVLFLGVGVVF